MVFFNKVTEIIKENGKNPVRPLKLADEQYTILNRAIILTTKWNRFLPFPSEKTVCMTTLQFITASFAPQSRSTCDYNHDIGLSVTR